MKTRQEHLEDGMVAPDTAEVAGMILRRIGVRETLIFGRLRIPVLHLAFLEKLANGEIDDSGTEAILKAAFVLSLSKSRALAISQMPESFDAEFLDWTDEIPVKNLKDVAEWTTREILRVAAAMFEPADDADEGAPKNAHSPAN